MWADWIAFEPARSAMVRRLSEFGYSSNAGLAGQTALSGSQIKPPALPEVHDSSGGGTGSIVKRQW